MNHTVRIFLYLFVFTVILNLVIEIFGIPAAFHISIGEQHRCSPLRRQW